MSLYDKIRQQKLFSTTVVLFTLSVGILIGTVINVHVDAARGSTVAPDATPLVVPKATEIGNEFTKLAKKLDPSVVNISVEISGKRNLTTRNRQSQPDDGDDDGSDLLRRFFGQQRGGGAPQIIPQGPQKSEATGTGFIVDSNGYIITNNHVVENGDKITVKMHGDPTEYRARVVGTDRETDLAVIKIDAKHALTPVSIGNSDAVQVGDWAVAIGSPFGLQATVTAGIISAKERDLGGGPEHQFQRFLQTDAAINRGNSGGPLLAINGDVIGINTAILSDSGGYQGVGFALPMNEAARVYNEIIKGGKVTRGSIGISFTRSETPQALANLKVAGVKEGVFVEIVAPGGPSAKAGMKEGDVITAINGKPIHDGNQLVNIVSTTPVGSALDLTVDREGKKHDLKVVVGDLAQIFPERFGNGRDDSAKSGESTAVSFGMNIQPLTDRQLENLGVKTKGGVQVISVEPNSFAEDIQLAPNDIIVSINRQPVNTVDDVQRIRSALKPGDAVQFKVLRRAGRNSQDWNPTFVAGALPMGQ